MVGCGIFVIIVQHCRCAWWESLASSNNHKDFVSHITFQETSIYHLGKRKIIFKSAFERVYVSSQQGILHDSVFNMTMEPPPRAPKENNQPVLFIKSQPPSISLPSMQHRIPKETGVKFVLFFALSTLRHLYTSFPKKNKHRKLENVLERTKIII